MAEPNEVDPENSDPEDWATKWAEKIVWAIDRSVKLPDSAKVPVHNAVASGLRDGDWVGKAHHDGVVRNIHDANARTVARLEKEKDAALRTGELNYQAKVAEIGKKFDDELARKVKEHEDRCFHDIEAKNKRISEQDDLLEAKEKEINELQGILKTREDFNASATRNLLDLLEQKDKQIAQSLNIADFLTNQNKTFDEAYHQLLEDKNRE